MSLIVAVHGTSGFAALWKETIVSGNHQLREVNGYDSDIINQLTGCDAFLWHLNQDESDDLNYARSILFSAEAKGIKVFPNHATSWHFDDKLSQKYILEAIGAPLAPTWIFYSKETALKFLEQAEYPLVFKLRRGAGSINVKIVNDKNEGAALVKAMFFMGRNPFPLGGRIHQAAQRAKTRSRKESYGVRIPRVLKQMIRKTLGFRRERGYVLFQRFIAGNDHDIRATVIGKRCFVFRREVRTGDFRASGSGMITYLDKESVPRDVVELAFHISEKLGFQSMAFDFVRDPVDKRLLLLEMSYVFNAQAVANCPGYFDHHGQWHSESIWPQDAILKDLLAR